MPTALEKSLIPATGAVARLRARR